MNALFVFIGGGLGSLLRYGIAYWCKSMFTFSFPWATFLANSIACIIVGLSIVLLPALSSIKWMPYLLLIGFCGGLSTFSTFSMENAELLMRGNYTAAIINILMTVSLGIVVLLVAMKNS